MGFGRISRGLSHDKIEEGKLLLQYNKLAGSCQMTRAADSIITGNGHNLQQEAPYIW